jgi:hypothetical protein
MTKKRKALMETECIQGEFDVQGFAGKKILVRNDGGNESSDGGLLLLMLMEKRHHIISRFSRCFQDLRNPKLILHPVQRLLKQRIFGLCQGYEDINDHDSWRDDPLLSVACEVTDKSVRLAGKGTLNRLELGGDADAAKDRYKNIRYKSTEIQKVMVDLFMETHAGGQLGPQQIIIDVDATDDPVHGNQEGSYFHGYYDEYCYLPLYMFIGDFPVWAELGTADVDPADGVIPALSVIIGRIRQRWPWTRIIIRGDGGFNRPEILSWLEMQFRVSYVFGMPKNRRLLQIIGKEMHDVELACKASGEAERAFTEFQYQTRKSWERPRRVIAKAEQLPGRANPRFIVTNLEDRFLTPQHLYEKLYCARGNMENRIKEQKLFMYADRLSTQSIRGNQLRLWFSTIAYVFMLLLRKNCYGNEPLARAQASSIRLRLLKVAARVSISVRRIVVHIPSSFPYWDAWFKLRLRLQT